MFKILLCTMFAVSLCSCSFSQSQYQGSKANKDYQEYLVKKQELVVFEKARTTQELKNWK